jgi:RNA polymerase sigma factor (sigma-70 family)
VTQLLFGALVARYQDAAFAYAYAILRDYAAAEDATQAAFLNAWQHWSDLREPEAFGGWLRTIVRTECYRITRRARLDTVPLDESQARAELEEQEITKWETRTLLLKAIGGLSESDRALIALRYMSELSYQEMSEFLGTPIAIIKKRLHDSRRRLRARWQDLMGDGKQVLQAFRPSSNARLQRRIMNLTDLFKKIVHGDVSAVAAALDSHPELLDVRGENERFWCGSTSAFAIAVASGQLEIVKLFIDRGVHRKIATTDVSPLALAAIEGRRQVVEALLDAGMPIDIFAAAALGDTERAAELIRMNSALVRDRSFDGKTPLHYCRSIDVAKVFLDAGAELDVIDDSGQTPLQWIAATGRYKALSKYLMTRGAKADPTDIFSACAYGDIDAVRKFLNSDATIVNARRPRGRGVPAPMIGTQPLHEAAVRGEREIGQLLIESHADVNARAGNNDVTPLHSAAAGGHLEMVKLLLDAGADPNARDGSMDATPQAWAKFFGHSDVVDFLSQLR